MAFLDILIIHEIPPVINAGSATPLATLGIHVSDDGGIVTEDLGFGPGIPSVPYTIVYGTTNGQYLRWNQDDAIWEVTFIQNGDLPASGVTAATYGDSTHVGRFTVGADGRITSASSVAIAVGASASGIAGRVQLSDGSGNLTSAANLHYDIVNDILQTTGLVSNRQLRRAALAVKPTVVNNLSGTYDNVSFGAQTFGVYRVESLLSNTTYTGIAPGTLNGNYDGQTFHPVFIIENNDATYSLTLKANDTGSAAANRFDFVADVVLAPKECCAILYGGSTKWRLLYVGRITAAGLADPGANGIVVRTSANVTTNRTLTAGAGISISAGDGISGNPTITATGASSGSLGLTMAFTGGRFL